MKRELEHHRIAAFGISGVLVLVSKTAGGSRSRRASHVAACYRTVGGTIRQYRGAWSRCTPETAPMCLTGEFVEMAHVRRSVQGRATRARPQAGAGEVNDGRINGTDS